MRGSVLPDDVEEASDQMSLIGLLFDTPAAAAAAPALAVGTASPERFDCVAENPGRTTPQRTPASCACFLIEQAERRFETLFGNACLRASSSDRRW